MLFNKFRSFNLKELESIRSPPINKKSYSKVCILFKIFERCFEVFVPKCTSLIKIIL